MVPKLADLTYAHTLVIKSIHEVGTIWPMDLVFMTFCPASRKKNSGSLGYLFGILRHNLLDGIHFRHASVIAEWSILLLRISPPVSI